MALMILKLLSKCLTRRMMGKTNFILINHESVYDRFIDVDELMGVMVMLGNPRSEDEVRIMIAEEDKNGDGVIDREEFFAMLDKNRDILE